MERLCAECNAAILLEGFTVCPNPECTAYRRPRLFVPVREARDASWVPDGPAIPTFSTSRYVATRTALPGSQWGWRLDP